MNYHKVKDNSDLVRDPNTGAILIQTLLIMTNTLHNVKLKIKSIKKLRILKEIFQLLDKNLMKSNLYLGSW